MSCVSPYQSPLKSFVMFHDSSMRVPCGFSEVLQWFHSGYVRLYKVPQFTLKLSYHKSSFDIHTHYKLQISEFYYLCYLVRRY